MLFPSTSPPPPLCFTFISVILPHPTLPLFLFYRFLIHGKWLLLTAINSFLSREKEPSSLTHFLTETSFPSNFWLYYHCSYCSPGYPLCRSGQENWWTGLFPGWSGSISPRLEKKGSLLTEAACTCAWACAPVCFGFSSLCTENIWIITGNLRDQNGMEVKRKDTDF